MKHFNEKLLVEQLGRMGSAHRVIFAACCASRLLTAYESYSKTDSSADATTLNATLKSIWDIARSGEFDREYYESLLEKVMTLIPSEDGEWTPKRDWAEDAATSVAYVLRALLTEKPQEAAWAARRVYEAIDNYVINLQKIDIGKQGSEKQIANHPLVQTELSRQQRDIEELQAAAQQKNLAVVEERLRLRSQRERAIPVSQ